MTDEFETRDDFEEEGVQMLEDYIRDIKRGTDDGGTVVGFGITAVVETESGEGATHTASYIFDPTIKFREAVGVLNAYEDGLDAIDAMEDQRRQSVHEDIMGVFGGPL